MAEKKVSGTIVFKPEFETKLKKLKIKTRFAKAVKLYCKRGNHSLKQHLEELQQSNNWANFINHGFVWKNETCKTMYELINSKEHYLYWIGIQRK